MPLYSEALSHFSEVYARALVLPVSEPTAVVLATADTKGRPSARTVLLKDFNQDGFVFFTNQHSRKGAQLAENPFGALCFFWQELMEQVHVEGEIVTVSKEVADNYWNSRPCASQVGAWASLQSQPLAHRSILEKRFSEFQARFHGNSVPRPPHWSGYRLIPDRFEFWKAAPYRLHERTFYQKEEGGWEKSLLYP
ncbi:Pyridoxine/pyridoxamine 5'-phosphate oxidase [Gammaproteobacteria bacterium]